MSSCSHSRRQAMLLHSNLPTWTSCLSLAVVFAVARYLWYADILQHLELRVSHHLLALPAQFIQSQTLRHVSEVTVTIASRIKNCCHQHKSRKPGQRATSHEQNYKTWSYAHIVVYSNSETSIHTQRAPQVTQTSGETVEWLTLIAPSKSKKL